MNDLTPDHDAELVRRAQAGDRSAFGAIVGANQTAALRLAIIISGDSTEAYDIVQDAFVKAYRSIGSIRDTDALGPWLLRIVANEAKNSRRGRGRRDRRHVRLAVLRPDVVGAPDDVALDHLRERQVVDAVGRLSLRDRRVIACRFFADLSEKETANVLGVAPGTVKSQTARALARLRIELADD